MFATGLLYGRASGGRTLLSKWLTAATPKRTIYTPSPATAALVEREDKVCAHTYHPLPVVLSRGRGCRVWDVDGKGNDNEEVDAAMTLRWAGPRSKKENLQFFSRFFERTINLITVARFRVL
jgi:hypothetical protein